MTGRQFDQMGRKPFLVCLLWGHNQWCSELTPDCTQESILAVLWGPDRMPGIKFNWQVGARQASYPLYYHSGPKYPPFLGGYTRQYPGLTLDSRIIIVGAWRPLWDAVDWNQSALCKARAPHPTALFSTPRTLCFKSESHHWNKLKQALMKWN